MIRLIAAVGRNGELGLKSGLPWGHLFPEDRRAFRARTEGGIVIVGGRTWPSVAGLQNTVGRRFLQDNTGVSPQRFLDLMQIDEGRPIWIAGGAKTYLRWLHLVEEKVITVLDWTGPCDLWMPAEIWSPAVERV